jgi:chemotaxis family two-component system response regulator PixG
MLSNLSSITKLVHQLETISQQRATGELNFASGDRQCSLYFVVGRLLYATGIRHRVRRWFRALQQGSPALVAEIMKNPGEMLPAKAAQGTDGVSQPWEFQILHQKLIESQLSVAEAKKVIYNSAKEVFFSLNGEPESTICWFPGGQHCPERFLSLPLSSEEIEEVFQEGQQLWQEWEESGLSHISPMIAPVLRTPQPGQEKIRLLQLLNGKNTLWDIAFQVQRPITTLTGLLRPWIEGGKIELREVPDISLPSPKQQATPASTNHAGPLIACIDDSPVITQALEKILAPAGYRVMKITEPLRQMSTLVKHKPDLIFLDLMMPNTSGYALCTFLRKTPVFQKTPIIILTSRDGIVDRTRAKLTGASDFLGKPPEPQKVLQMVHKHLKSEVKTQQKPQLLFSPVGMG